MAIKKICRVSIHHMVLTTAILVVSFASVTVAFSAQSSSFVNSRSIYKSHTQGLTSTQPRRISHTVERSMVDPNMIGTSLSDAWTSYNVALEQSPLLVKSVTAGVILGCADFTGQALERSMKDDPSEESSVDWGRALRFAIFGFVLQAPWNHFYYLALDGALPPTEDPLSATTGIKVAIDQFVQAPIFTVLIFYFLGLLEGKTMDDVKDQLDDDYKDTMLANWKLWVPATAVNIAFCPPLLRVLFLNVVFFFWSIFLSLKLNKNSDVEVDK
mmetsp:Transcript_19751/g.35848  ORF Transcript_19751/g.35848 Transcript_19751/m.35848 type:complete len:271 (-) Transcript_19751:312-1124(-)